MSDEVWIARFSIELNRLPSFIGSNVHQFRNQLWPIWPNASLLFDRNHEKTIKIHWIANSVVISHFAMFLWTCGTSTTKDCSRKLRMAVCFRSVWSVASFLNTFARFFSRRNNFDSNFEGTATQPWIIVCISVNFRILLFRTTQNTEFNRTLRARYVRRYQITIIAEKRMFIIHLIALRSTSHWM